MFMLYKRVRTTKIKNQKNHINSVQPLTGVHTLAFAQLVQPRSFPVNILDTPGELPVECQNLRGVRVCGDGPMHLIIVRRVLEQLEPGTDALLD